MRGGMSFPPPPEAQKRVVASLEPTLHIKSSCEGLARETR